MSLPNACGCYRMPSGPERARLESLGAENIQGACACLSASMLGSSFEGGEKKIKILVRTTGNPTIIEAVIGKKNLLPKSFQGNALGCAK